MIKLETPLSEIYGVGPRFLAKLNKLGINTVMELIRHYPFRYEDYSIISPIDEVAPGQTVTVKGEVVRTAMRRSFRRKVTIVEGIVSDGTGEIKVVWFNQPYVKNALEAGGLFNFSGKVGTYGGEQVLSNPMYELANKVNTSHTGRLVPIYPETRGMTSKGLRYIIKPILENLEEIEEWLPLDILDQYELPEMNGAIRQIHFPLEVEEAEKARKRFAFEELFLLSLVNLQRKIKRSQEKANAIENKVELMKTKINELPFEMTKSQKKCLLEILKDMEKPVPMNRLMQGDVGSGKTVVAGLAGINAVANGWQVALMAPTEVLTRQHYKTLTTTTWPR